MTGFCIVWILLFFFITGIYCLHTRIQPIILLLNPLLSSASSSGTPSYFLSSLVLSCLSPFTQCLVHLFFAFPIVISQGFSPVSVHYEIHLLAECAFSFHGLSGSYTIFYVQGPEHRTWFSYMVFVLIPLLDCKLHEGRDWVLLILSPFWLQSPNISLGDNSLSYWLCCWWDSQCILPKGCSFSGVWILSHGTQGLTMIGADSSWPRCSEEVTLISSCLPDPWSCSGPWTLRGLVLQIFLRICELSHILIINVSFSLSLSLTLFHNFKDSERQFLLFLPKDFYQESYYD